MMTFADKVYDMVAKIPKGRVATYGQVAEMIGRKGGARAVGNALHINPFAPVVPCHRVVSAEGYLADNFGGGGAEVQKQRLEKEGVSIIEVQAPNRRYKVDLAKQGIVIESHPLEPFLPEKGKILFLGSFPPPKARWSMDFFYPNWINDFWRLQGLIHYNDQHHFEVKGQKCFCREEIIKFCNSIGLAFFDTAMKVCRLKGNASDEFLEIIESSDIVSMLKKMPECDTIVTTGGKSSEELKNIFHMDFIPKVGEYVIINISLDSNKTSKRNIRWYRMPSTSRAYPMSLQKKKEYYLQLFS